MSGQVVSKSVLVKPSQGLPEGFLAEFERYGVYFGNAVDAVKLLNSLFRKYGRGLWINPEAVEVVRVGKDGKYVEIFLNGGWRVYVDNDVVEVYER